VNSKTGRIGFGTQNLMMIASSGATQQAPPFMLIVK
jgi:hypothetical protein